VTVSCQWLPYIRGALYQLLLQYTWTQDDPALVALAQQRANSLISFFDECSSADIPFACFEDFILSAGPWTNENVSPYSPAFFGVQSLGAGWVSTDACASAFGDCKRGVFIIFQPGHTFTLTYFKTVIDMNKGPGTVPEESGVYFYNGATQVHKEVYSDWSLIPEGTSEIVYSNPAGITIDTILIQIICDDLLIGQTPDGGCHVLSAAYQGAGLTSC